MPESLPQLLDLIVENIPDMIFLKDAQELRFVLFNKAGENLIGVQRSDMIGKNDYDFFPKDQADFFTSKDREVLKGGVLLDIPEEKIKTKSNGERVLHTKKIPIMDTKGKPLYLLGISEDITEKKQHEDQLKERALELETMNATMVDRELKMIELKEQLQALTGKKSL